MSTHTTSAVLDRHVDVSTGTEYKLIYTFGGTLGIWIKAPGEPDFHPLRLLHNDTGRLPEILDAWLVITHE